MLSGEGSQPEMQSQAQSEAHVIACHECDALHHLNTLPEQTEAYCACCDAFLYRHVDKATVHRSLALHLTALMLFVMANTFPFMSLKLAGRVETDMLLSAPLALFEMGMSDIGLLVLLTTIVFPLITMLAALYLLIPAAFARRAYACAPVFRMLQRLMPWSLLGVFMLAVLIAIVKLLDLAVIEVGISLMAFAVLLPVSVMAQKDMDSALFWPHRVRDAGDESDETLGRGLEAGLLHCHTCSLVVREVASNSDPNSDGNSDGQHIKSQSDQQATELYCPRCADHLHSRKPNSIARTWALLIAATLLLLPANILPIMTVTRFGQGDPSTILSGVVHLIAAGMWPLGLIVFFASIMVPVSKLVTLVFLLWSVHVQSKWNPVDRIRLYRMTERIGSWSMVDIFIIGILTSLVSLDALATIEPGIAASYFAASVVLTMFAAQSFDPRLIWDAAGEHDADIGQNNENRLGQGIQLDS